MYAIHVLCVAKNTYIVCVGNTHIVSARDIYIYIYNIYIYIHLYIYRGGTPAHPKSLVSKGLSLLDVADELTLRDRRVPLLFEGFRQVQTLRHRFSHQLLASRRADRGTDGHGGKGIWWR
jgi:hypothetical protein